MVEPPVKEEILLNYGERRIPITIVFEPRRALTISVSPDKRVEARAPVGRPREEVMARLRKRKQRLEMVTI